MSDVDFMEALVKESLPDVWLPFFTVNLSSSHSWVGPGAFYLSTRSSLQHPLLLASGRGQAGVSPWQLVPPSALAKPGAQRQKKDPWLLRHSPRGAQYSSPVHSSTSAGR